MVRSTLLCAVLALLSTSNFAQTICTEATEFQPELCPLKLSRIVAVAITQNGARSSLDAEPNLDCSRFKLNTNTVRRYFNKARHIKDELDIHHKLDWLPCYASGTLTFADGKKATWRIEQSQTGELVIDEDKALFLYCPQCKSKPFLW